MTTATAAKSAKSSSGAKSAAQKPQTASAKMPATNGIEETVESGATGARDRSRPARTSRPLIMCALCGGRTLVIDDCDWRGRIDIGLGQVSRRRECEDCKDRVTTVEVPKSELQRLRHDSYMLQVLRRSGQ